MSKSLRAVGAGLALALAAVTPARAQQLFPEWTVRRRVAPEALARGAEAVFWNPAGVGALTTRSEVLVVLLQSSQDLGLKGFAGAGALRLPRGTAVALGYQHFGVDDIQRTDAEPQTGTPDLMNVADDRFTLAAAQPVGGRGWIGALAEYDRSDSGVANTDGVVFGVGGLFSWQAGLAPALGGAVLTTDGGARWRAGAEAGLPGLQRPALALRAGYGISGESNGPSSLQHRLSLTAEFRNRLRLAAAAAVSRTAAETSIAPDLMGEFRVGRYVLGVVHEAVANGFGGATSAHLAIRF